jgi:hypothetical protein
VRLSELTASSRRVALVGLAKNTGKTVALATLLDELASSPEGERAGRRVGVTSVGRDGEERDVIDARIAKPRVRLAAGSLVATTDGLLRASAIPHELLEHTGMRTPLGRVAIARLQRSGTIEVAGPSAAADVRAVSDAMLAHGAEQVLIDGAVDRRAASSPDVADGLVLSTGAVLSHEIAEVVAQTRDAVDLVRLPHVDRTSAAGRLLRQLAGAEDARAAGPRASSHLLGEDLRPVPLPERFVLTSEAEQIAQLLDANPTARWLSVAGALPDRFLRNLVHPAHKRRRELIVVVGDPTRVFLWKRGPEWYRRQGIHLQTLEQIALQALTVNPVAPQSHSFESTRLRALLRETIADVPIFDVLHADYAEACQPASAV